MYRYPRFGISIMVRLIIILLLTVSFSLSAVEYGYLTTSDGVDSTMTLNDGELFEIIEITGTQYLNSYSANYNLRGLVPGTDTTLLNSAFDFNGPPSISLFYGPLELSLEAPGTTNITVLYKLTRATEPVQNITPLNTVVIPTDANGNVQIILESSTDLVNWTAASPGEYNAATQNRFFRVRAVVTGD